MHCYVGKILSLQKAGVTVGDHHLQLWMIDSSDCNGKHEYYGVTP
jgi:hypothetical protein